MTTSARENAAPTRRLLADVVAGGDDAETSAFLADGADVHDLVFGDLPGAMSPSAKVQPPLDESQLQIAFADLVATAERVAVRGTPSGGAPVRGSDGPAANRFSVAHGWFCRIEVGRIAELWSLPDGLGMFGQLGVIPSRADSVRRHSDREHLHV